MPKYFKARESGRLEDVVIATAIINIKRKSSEAKLSHTGRNICFPSKEFREPVCLRHNDWT